VISIFHYMKLTVNEPLFHGLLGPARFRDLRYRSLPDPSHFLFPLGRDCKKICWLLILEASRRQVVLLLNEFLVVTDLRLYR
jgi:hypothetical protein